MKPSRVTVAVVLSVIAIVISLFQPTYNFLTTMNKAENGKPSFSISRTYPDFYVFYTYTTITLRNNGTATAHDVSLELVFTDPPSQNTQAKEMASEIDAGQATAFEIPIGVYQLNSTVSVFSNVSNFEAIINIWCKELDFVTTFHFQHFIT